MELSTKNMQVQIKYESDVQCHVTWLNGFTFDGTRAAFMTLRHITWQYQYIILYHALFWCALLYIYIRCMCIFTHGSHSIKLKSCMRIYPGVCTCMRLNHSKRTYIDTYYIYIHIHIVHTHIRLHALHVQAMSALLPALQGVLARMSQCKLHPAHICTLEQDIREGEQIDCSIQVCLSQVYLVDVQQLHRLSTRLKHAVQPPLLLATPASRIQPTPASDFSLLVAE